MNLNRVICTVSAFLTVCLLGAGNAPAAPVPSPPNATPPPVLSDAPPDRPHTLGVGYKIGNGLGLMGGEIVVGLSKHISLGLQANYLHAESSLGDAITGYGVAPFAEFRLWPPGSTPYLSAGLLYAEMSLDDVRGKAPGGFANLGWQWLWQNGLAINVGAGVGYLGTIEATNGIDTVTRDGGPHFNIEASLRWFVF